MGSMVEEFEARGVEIESLKASLQSKDEEIAAMSLASDELAEKVSLVEAEMAEAAEVHKEATEQMQEIFEAKDEEISELTDKQDELQASLEQAHQNLELGPHAEVIEGADPVSEEGGEGADPVNHLEKVAGLSGAEKIAYYNEHKAEIDAAHKELVNK